MIGYAVRRLAQMPVVLFAIATLTFFLIRIAPGGPFDSERRLPAAIELSLRLQCDTDAPIVEQYVRFLESWVLARTDACTGMSLQYPSRAVQAMIGEAFPVSVHLGAMALLFALVVGLSLGIASSMRQNTWLDHGAMAGAILALSVPSFVLGPLLVLVVALGLGWLPPALWDGPSTWILPTITLGTPYAAYIARLTRAGMLEVVREDFMRTARAKGVSRRRLIFRHALRGGLLPVVTYLGPATSALFTGSVVVEQIFALPGLGRAFVDAALNRDYNVVLGVVLVYAVFLLATNLIVDLVYGWLDPRVRMDA